MTSKSNVLKARKNILPLVKIYWATCKNGEIGCKKTLEKAVKAFDETKMSFEKMGIPMPSANQIGYGEIRDTINQHARTCGFMD
jgi:hypothetical protein